MTGEWIRFGLCAFFTLLGVLFVIFATFGVFRFKYAMNRMHAAAMGDTLGLSLILLGLIIAKGWAVVSLKYIGIVLFFWIASPAASHMLARLELETNPHPEKHTALGNAGHYPGKEPDDDRI